MGCPCLYMDERGGSSFDWESKSESIADRLSTGDSMADQATVHIGDWRIFCVRLGIPSPDIGDSMKSLDVDLIWRCLFELQKSYFRN
jgi:hypothetical protein